MDRPKWIRYTIPGHDNVWHLWLSGVASWCDVEISYGRRKLGCNHMYAVDDPLEEQRCQKCIVTQVVHRLRRS